MNTFTRGEPDAIFEVTRGQVTAFTKSLVHALYDRTVEQQRGIRYYYDADVVVWMILGVYGGIPEEQDLKGDVVRALLSAGFLGKVHIVRPHALEMLDRMRNHEARFSRTRRIAFRQRVEEYFENIGVLAYLRELHETLENTHDPEQRLEEFVDAICRMGPRAFVAYEIVHGEWKQRLKRLNRDVIRFEHFGHDARKLVENEEVWRLKRAISTARVVHRRQTHRDARETSVNDLTDSVALATIHGLIEDSRNRPKEPEIRFHTNTRSLQMAVESDLTLSKLLSYDLDPQWATERKWGADLVFRSVDYYLLRASFSALRFLESQTSTDADTITIDELQNLAADLTQKLHPMPSGKDDRELLAEIEKRRVGDRTLREILIEMELASFVSRLLREYRPPEALRSLLAPMIKIDMFSLPEREYAPARLDSQALKLTRVLRTQITSVQGWLDIARAIRLRIDELTRDDPAGANFHVTNAYRDLGLVRWGKLLADEDVAFAVAIVDDLFSGDEERSTKAATTFSIRAEDKLTESACLTIGAILWMLGLFDRVGTLVINYQNDHAELPLTLDLMRASSRLRQHDDFFSQIEKTRYMEGVTEAVRRVNNSIRGRLLIGLAYVSFYVAYTEGEEHVQAIAAGRSSSSPFAINWATKSFEFAHEALNFLSGDALGRAFAVNHAAYVGALYRIEPDLTEEYLAELRRLHEEKNASDEAHRLWHYRFADTIGAAAYYAGYRTWSAIGRATTDTTRWIMQQEACTHLAAAEEIMLTARPYFGDPEIPEHLRDIQRLKQQIGCGREPADASR